MIDGTINGFSTDGSPSYAFLDNAYMQHQQFTLVAQAPDSPVAHLAGLSAPSAEHFLQAAKTLDRNTAENVLQAGTPKEARDLGRQLTTREDWDHVKDQALVEILRSKFSNTDLRAWLLETGDAEIINRNLPGNHDTVWGVCDCDEDRGRGQNGLGRSLMALRAEFAESQP